MCFATVAAVAGIAGAVASAGGALYSGAAQSSAAQYNGQVAANNATIANQNAVYAQAAGSAKQQTQGLQDAERLASIKSAGLAANNIDVNSGSAVTVQKSQRELGNLDQETVQNNALLQAYGYRTQATSDTAQSQLYKTQASTDLIGGDITAGGDLLRGAQATNFSFNSAGQGGGASQTYPTVAQDQP